MNQLKLPLIALVLGVMLAALPRMARPAAAGEVWCWDDPVIEVNNVSISINLGVRQTDLAAVSGAEIVITVPAEANARVTYIDTTYFTPSVRFVAVETAKGVPVVQDFSAQITLNSGRAHDYQIVVMREESKTKLVETTAAQANRPTSLSFRLY